MEANMKKILIACAIIMILAPIPLYVVIKRLKDNEPAVSESVVSTTITKNPLYTFVVEHEGKSDTIIADNYTTGNYVGIGKATLFYIDGTKVAVILIPKNRQFSIKTIK